MSEFKGIGSQVFIGQKKSSVPDDFGHPIMEVDTKFTVINVCGFLRFRKSLETSYTTQKQYAAGWALNYFLEQFGKELFNLKSLRFENAGSEAVIEAEYYLSLLTVEKDPEQWFRDYVDTYIKTPSMVGGYTYYPKAMRWDSVEIVEPIEF